MKNILDDQTRALFAVGLIKPIDFFFVLILGALACGVGGAWLFSSLSSTEILIAIGLGCLLLLLWAIMLIFRCCYHVVMARSEINTMPEAAAKLAISYQIGEQ